MTAKALLSIKREELINKKEFDKAVLNAELETFVIYISVLEAQLVEITIYPFKAA